MKFKNGKSGTIIAYDLKTEDIIKLLKIQIKMRFIFLGEKEQEVGSLFLLNRVVNGDIQMIEMTEDVNGKKGELTTYSDVINSINNYIDKYQCQIIFNATTFKKKQPLIAIVSDIKDEIIQGCVYIDYDDGMFKVINKKQNNLPNELYFWEETGSLFVFGRKGPQLEFVSNFESIEEIICK